MEPLREMTRGSWWGLRSQFETNWPFGVEGHCLLDMLIKTPGLSDTFNMKVYCPKGDISNGMVAISDIDTYHLYVCPVVMDNLPGLEEALLFTSVIDWKKDIIIPSVMPEVMKILDSVGEKLKMEVKRNGFVIKYLCSKITPQFENLEPPLGTHVSPLKVEDLDLINSSWTFRSASSKEYFKKLMEKDLMHVLYSTEDVPLAWVGVDETGSLCHLYSRESCRRQGYGAFITKVAMNELLARGQYILTYALIDNFTPQKLFVKLGFQNLGLTSWVFMTKKKSETPSCSFCTVVDYYPKLN